MHTTLLRVKYMPNHKKLTCYNVMIQRIITSISTHLRSSRHRLQVYIFTRDRLPSITRNKRFENDLWTIQPTVVNNFFAFPRDGINLSNAVGARERATCVFRQSANLFVVGVRKCWASTNSSRTFSALDDRPLLLISLDDVLRGDLLVRETEELAPVSSVLLCPSILFNCQRFGHITRSNIISFELDF